MLEGNHVSRISVRGFAVASATAVTTVGAVVGVAAGDQGSPEPIQAAGSATTILGDIPSGQQVQQASLTMQAQAQADAADTAAKKSAEESARKQAAQDATAKKKAADEKAAEELAAKAKAEREKKEEIASRSESRTDLSQQSSYTISEVKAIARQIVGAGQFQCFSNIIDHESGWNYKAQNPSSGAYGLVQALPGTKMASAGADWRTNPATQIKWGLKYMDSRYGSPCGAWSFWQSNHWY